MIAVGLSNYLSTCVASEMLCQPLASIAHLTNYASISVLATQKGKSCHWRNSGEYHLYNPNTIQKLQHAVRTESFSTFQEYTDLLDRQTAQLCTLRGLLEIRGQGIVRVPFVSPVALALVVDLMAAADCPRMPEPAERTVELCGVGVRRIFVASGTADGAARVRAALSWPLYESAEISAA